MTTTTYNDHLTAAFNILRAEINETLKTPPTNQAEIEAIYDKLLQLAAIGHPVDNHTKNTVCADHITVMTANINAWENQLGMPIKEAQALTRLRLTIKESIELADSYERLMKSQTAISLEDFKVVWYPHFVRYLDNEQRDRVETPLVKALLDKFFKVIYPNKDFIGLKENTEYIIDHYSEPKIGVLLRINGAYKMKLTDKVYNIECEQSDVWGLYREDSHGRYDTMPNSYFYEILQFPPIVAKAAEEPAKLANEPIVKNNTPVCSTVTITQDEKTDEDWEKVLTTKPDDLPDELTSGLFFSKLLIGKVDRVVRTSDIKEGKLYYLQNGPIFDLCVNLGRTMNNELVFRNKNKRDYNITSSDLNGSFSYYSQSAYHKFHKTDQSIFQVV
jgi:hypothetical protein